MLITLICFFFFMFSASTFYKIKMSQKYFLRGRSRRKALNLNNVNLLNDSLIILIQFCFSSPLFSNEC